MPELGDDFAARCMHCSGDRPPTGLLRGTVHPGCSDITFALWQNLCVASLMISPATGTLSIILNVQFMRRVVLRHRAAAACQRCHKDAILAFDGTDV